jgi:hypothetical protein
MKRTSLYVVVVTVPVYDNRDAFVGTRTYRVESLPAYATRAYAEHRAACINNDANPNRYADDVLASVMQSDGNTLEHVKRERSATQYACDADDIPF